jgi:5-amino-6-(5-phosphoribosylamino)uracil reductase
MDERPYTVLNCCISLDGYLDDSSVQRLVLSSRADLDRVDALRAASDAVLVGAATVRADNPQLLVRSPDRVAERVAAGRSPTPVKVTVSAAGKLDPGAAFFASGDPGVLVYCPGEGAEEARAALPDVATVVACGTPMCLREVVEDLHRRGVRRLLVEGGATVLGQFLTEGLADELHVAIAPFLVGDSAAPRFLPDGDYPWTAQRRARLLETRVLDDVVLLRYALSSRCPGPDVL